jgi:hypothetical protein
MNGYNFEQDGHFYKPHYVNQKHYSARKICIDEGGNLAVPYPELSFQIVQKYINQSSPCTHVGIVRKGFTNASRLFLTDDGKLPIFLMYRISQFYLQLMFAVGHLIDPSLKDSINSNQHWVTGTPSNSSIIVAVMKDVNGLYGDTVDLATCHMICRRT